MAESLTYSSRKNSLTSISTTGTGSGANKSVRNMSTDNLISLEDKFMKKQIKKVPNGFGSKSSPPQSSHQQYHLQHTHFSSPQSQQQTFHSQHPHQKMRQHSVPQYQQISPQHMPPQQQQQQLHILPKGSSSPNSAPDSPQSANGGAFYFPNGEVFRPRATPTKRNRPNKIHHSIPSGGSPQGTSAPQFHGPPQQIHGYRSQQNVNVSQIAPPARNTPPSAFHQLPSHLHQQFQPIQTSVVHMPAVIANGTTSSASSISHRSSSNNSDSQDSIVGDASLHSLNSLNNSSSTTVTSVSNSIHVVPQTVIPSIYSQIKAFKHDSCNTISTKSDPSSNWAVNELSSNSSDKYVEEEVPKGINLASLAETSPALSTFSSEKSASLSSLQEGEHMIIAESKDLQKSESNSSSFSHISVSSSFSSSSSNESSTTMPNSNVARSTSNTPTTSINTEEGNVVGQTNIFNDQHTIISPVTPTSVKSNSGPFDTEDRITPNVRQESSNESLSTEVTLISECHNESVADDNDHDNDQEDTVHDNDDTNVEQVESEVDNATTKAGDNNVGKTPVNISGASFNKESSSSDETNETTDFSSSSRTEEEKEESEASEESSEANTNRNSRSSILPEPTIDDEDYSIIEDYTFEEIEVVTERNEVVDSNRTPVMTKLLDTSNILGHDEIPETMVDRVIDIDDEHSIHIRSPPTSAPTTPRSSMHFESNDHDGFVKLLQDTQNEVPPRADVIVIHKPRRKPPQEDFLPEEGKLENAPVLEVETLRASSSSPPLLLNDKPVIAEHDEGSNGPSIIGEHQSKAMTEVLGSLAPGKQIPRMRSLLDVAESDAIKKVIPAPTATIQIPSRSGSSSTISSIESSNHYVQPPPTYRVPPIRTLKARTKSLPSLNDQASTWSSKKSPSTANFKSLWNKIKVKLPDKDTMIPVARVVTANSTTSSSTTSKKIKKSFSFGNLRKAPSTTSSPPLPAIPVVDSNSNALPKSPRKSLFEEIPHFEIENLPTIETESDLFGDMMDNFDTSINYDDLVKPIKPTISNSSAVDGKAIDPFLNDDELTKDQIKDQQEKDEEVSVSAAVSKDIFTHGDYSEDNSINNPRHSTDSVYIDENIKFLQDEFVWSSLEDGRLSRVLIEKEEPEMAPNSVVPERKVGRHGGETIIINSEQLYYIFNNLTDFQRRHLPPHLKYIKQFRDYKYVEISVMKFEDLSEVEMKSDIVHSAPILKKKHDASAPKKKVMFSNKIFVNETFAPEMYKRYNKAVTQYTLTESSEINKIKNELNYFKCNEMLVHESSQNNTHFFY
ncbi:hypothetical serine rich protein [Scheffersomyces stipitis CBS 6054]|uniref:Hypothetical serine rich protein n=1 Tax=Scheffersomyces stipitis (strain ATCC 58785 / CBS 6054 / NBRC 10063 / NRRL Y-11545) TaxID=322104 RepID=A3LTS1_PICST|nr:hypothetical serine rich protein [Scheffersomyces stipitis CBS 6054]ABN66111.2 hypothetical serine rich protein [Scheffersomyces stipitis CBS 6054]